MHSCLRPRELFTHPTVISNLGKYKGYCCSHSLGLDVCVEPTSVSHGCCYAATLALSHKPHAEFIDLARSNAYEVDRTKHLSR